MPGARVRLSFQGRSTEVVADEEGHFRVDLVPPQPGSLSARNAVDLELLDPPPVGTRAAARAQAEVFVPPAGAGGDEGNPLFCVSSSPWNLHATLREFLRVQDLPPGPLLLKDFGEHTLFTMNKHGQHKLARIEEVFDACPDLSFILVGDSGRACGRRRQDQARSPGRGARRYAQRPVQARRRAAGRGGARRPGAPVSWQHRGWPIMPAASRGFSRHSKEPHDDGCR